MSNSEKKYEEYFEMLSKKCSKEQIQVLVYMYQKKVTTFQSGLTSKKINEDSFKTPLSTHSLKNTLIILDRLCFLDKTNYKYYLTEAGCMMAANIILKLKNGLIK